MENGPQLGKSIEDGDKRRDAIHIAVASVVAEYDLLPGQHVGLVKPDDMELVGPDAPELIGIVDPFLVGSIKAGTRFWLLLYPNTIKSLRHLWTHPAFEAVAVEQRKAVLNGRP